MIRERPFPYTSSLNMAPVLVANILGAGLALQLQHGVFSKRFCPSNKVSQLLTEIRALTNNQESPELRVYITGDGLEVYEDSFMSVARPDGVTFHPTLILVGTRLGTDKINPVYEEALKSSLQMPQSVGIAG